MLSVSKAVIYFSCEAFELSKGFYLLLSNSNTKRNMPQACIRVCCENKTKSNCNSFTHNDRKSLLKTK